MAKSKHSNKPGHSKTTHHANANHALAKKHTRNASWIVGIFMALLGLAVGFFAGGDLFSSATGAIVGGIAGYFAGLSIDKNAEIKNK